jgi:hypothetical protein
MPFKPSLMFESETGTFQSEAPFSCSTLAYTLGIMSKSTQAEKACLRSVLLLIRNFINDEEKSFEILNNRTNCY